MFENVKTLLKNLSNHSEIEGNLLAAAGSQSIKTIFVTSCHDKEGKTSSALILAISLATKSNAKVLLIEGNFNSPAAYSFFNSKCSPGMTDFLNLSTPLETVCRQTEYKNLAFMPHGSEAVKSQDTLKPESFKNKLDILKERFDYIIFDGPSSFGNSDAIIFAKFFDGIVIVVECEKTRWEVLDVVKEKIQQVGGKILGVILNKRKYYIPGALYASV